MATERLSMRKIREIRSHKWAVGCSHREVAASLGVSIRAVSAAEQRARAAGLDWPTIAALDDDALAARLYGATLAERRRPLPDPAWTAEKTEKYMRGWYYPLISTVSVHEVWPGHYLQFLNARNFPSDVRKVFGANTNIEGWAHYCEQMMIDEGLHADEPKYRLAQIQDALLRNAREAALLVFQ